MGQNQRSSKLGIGDFVKCDFIGSFCEGTIVIYGEVVGINPIKHNPLYTVIGVDGYQWTFYRHELLKISKAEYCVYEVMNN